MDLRFRNQYTEKDKTPLPNQDLILQTVAANPFRSKIDLTDGYHNIRVEEADEKYTTFMTPYRQFRSKVI